MPCFSASTHSGVPPYQELSSTAFLLPMVNQVIRRIKKVIVNDSMMRRIVSGDNAVMIRKSQGRKYGLQIICRYAGRAQTDQIFCLVFIRQVITESVG